MSHRLARFRGPRGVGFRQMRDEFSKLTPKMTFLESIPVKFGMLTEGYQDLVHAKYRSVLLINGRGKKFHISEKD
jgi:hypothetical protein